ncbi:uncharacterized protein A1O9_01875 [Exophiala aquamarina CBS 119918]|uniref:Major facilitator superfamily (MFS) profile domain-containing protein n=1 Tax=Exophiala aquamarina CBS 119918 TaxID=1182545 RepID=A0A072PXK8_9EURO|nr:uncharacterized protein A1O9_01875 [Exophiala aquamarina CBS 119918]KEF60315.1 hypothetical protein A1O9_01875 [Exophiala aquamarina CBS 119918]
MGLGGTHSYASVTVVRFLLGVFEAGLFPGLVYYLAFWYRSEKRSLQVAIILASATLAGAFGGAIAFGVGHMNQTAGMSAWRWLFILEGLPSILSAVSVWFLLPDYPEEAAWLTADEKQLAARRLATEGSKGTAKSLDWQTAKATLTDWRLYAHYAIYHDRSSRLHGFGSATTDSLQRALWMLDRCGHGLVCLHSPASWLAEQQPPLHRTVGLALAMNISFGAPGQIVGVWIYKANEKKQGYPSGHWTNAALLFFVATGCLTLRFYYRWRNMKFAGGKGDGMVREFTY